MKGSRAVKGEGNGFPHETKGKPETEKEMGKEDTLTEEDDMIQLDIDVVELTEDMERIEELK